MSLLLLFNQTGGGSPLFNGCVAAWKLSDLTDATGRGNTLTNNNLTTFNTGKIGNAGYFTRASSQYLSLADNADVSTGNVDFTIACWVYLTDKTTRQMIVTKDDDTAGSREYILSYDQAGDRFRFQVGISGDDVSTLDAVANTFGSPSTATWYCLIAGYDTATQKAFISVNDGALDQSGTGTPQTSGGAQFRIGAREYASFEEHLNGRIDAVHIWKRVLTTDERTEFYNSGNGVEFSAGSPDVTLPLTGIVSTFTSGTLIPDSSLAIAGSAASLAIGTLSVTSSVTVSGQESTLSAGSLVVSNSVSISGQESLASPGTLGADLVTPLSGSVSSVSIGSVVASPIFELSGLSSAFDIGSMVSDTVTSLTGSEAFSDLGNVLAENNASLTGLAIAAAAGTITPEGDSSITLGLTGISASFSIGALLPESAPSLIGVETVSAIGSVGLSVTLSLAGQTSAVEAGTAIAEFETGLTGVSNTVELGIVERLSVIEMDGSEVTGLVSSLGVAMEVGVIGSQSSLSAGSLGMPSKQSRTNDPHRYATIRVSQPQIGMT